MVIVQVSGHFEFTEPFSDGLLAEAMKRARYQMERDVHGAIVGEIDSHPCTPDQRAFLVYHQFTDSDCRLLHASADTDLWCPLCNMRLDRPNHARIHEFRSAQVG